MKNGNKFLNFILILQLSLAIASCIGTVKDSNLKTTNILNSSSSAAAVSFNGLIKATAISNDKIELQFSPADGADEIVYEIYVNNSPIPIKVNSRSLILNSSGNYLTTITSLQTNSTYSFNMRATPAGVTSDAKLDPNKSLTATTFNNKTADFLGISSVALSAGEAGRDSVIVKWNPATITGTAINLKDTDPVQYQITYISQLGGIANINNVNYTGPDRFTVYTPAIVNTPPALDRDSSYTISGLNPGSTYYFQVRAIHKGYIDNGTDPLYKKEENTRFAKITTLSSAGVFDFNGSQVLLTHPLAEPGLTALDISWLPAAGEFNHYRICYKKVANSNAAGAPTSDLLTDSDIDVILNNAAFCIQQPAEATNYRLSGLDSYAYYQIKVLACRTALCVSTDRINSALMQARVLTNIAQFSGILKVANPIDDTKLNEVQMTFDAPITSSGYLTRMKLYCYNNLNDTSPALLPTDGTTSAASGKTLCNGITVSSTFPSTLSDFSTFTSASLQFTTPIDGSRTYCLSLVPVIESPYLVQENLAGAVIKCFTPQIKTPNIVQFQGKNPTCSTLAGQDLGITWATPTGGLYSKFVIFYKQKNQGSDFFSFSDAVAAYVANNASSPYKWVDNIDSALVAYNIANLTPGKNYSIGILPYLNNGAQKLFGQFNLNVDDCMLPLPKATFNEWVDIFAIGPKEDGLTPVSMTGQRRYILETLDDDGIPVELKVQSDDRTPDTTDALAFSRTSSIYLDGVYGGKDGKDTNPLNQYSNSGIVKIAWKDVTFFNNTKSMNNYISTLEATPAPVKNARRYGYRVYRSDDNQMTWIDLTANSTKNKFQSSYNSGLVYPKAFSWKKRNNLASTNDNIVFFTDYSVKFSGTNGEEDRARIYWYKIIPVFDGQELTYDPATNLRHHIIRVTLPPRNMALVHRMIANRTVCLEMDKTLNKGEGENYSCDYNGLASSGKTNTPSIGSTVYDLGGDLLVDRFELSCPFTRGDQNYNNSDSTFGGNKLSFTGRSTYGNAFKGCFNDQANEYEPNQGAYSPTTNYKYNQVIPGDCFGRDQGFISASGTTACADPSKVITYRFIYPGSPSFDITSNCTDPTSLGTNITNVGNPSAQINIDNNFLFPTQSEFAAVYYMRGGWNSAWFTNTAYNYPGGNGKNLNYNGGHFPNSCTVNLPYVNSAGNYRPRWISVNSLFNKIIPTGSSTPINIATKTVAAVLADPNLYDSTNVKAPPADLITNNRYNSQTTMTRLFTSNSSKLPGLTGLNQVEYNTICNSYKVNVGIETSSKGFMSFDGAKPKRLMRKKESTVAGAWPQQYDSNKINSLENGTFIENSNYKGCNSSSRIDAPANPLTGTAAYFKGSTITPLFPDESRVHTSVTEGSSALDAANDSTEKCVSRFGLQDMAGNLTETNGDEILCDYSQDKMYIGIPDSIVNSVLYGSQYFDPNNVTPWNLSTPSSGSCSVVEKGGARSGNYTSGGTFNSIYNYLGLNTQVVSTAKRFDQDAVLSSRNGDGSFLDFGQNNIGTKLDKNNTLSLTNSTGASNYFSATLGLPLTCEQGCDANGSDNTLITADKIVAAKAYDTAVNPLGISIMDFPTNNSAISNSGLSEINQHDSIDTSSINATPMNYISGVNLGADPSDPSDNYAEMATHVPGSGFPNSLVEFSYAVPRETNFKMYTGGSSTTSAGRYSVFVSGYSDEYEHFQQYFLGSRCSIMINQD